MTRTGLVRVGSFAAYRPRWLRHDLIAGLTVWAVLVTEVRQDGVLVPVSRRMRLAAEAATPNNATTTAVPAIPNSG